uniref:Uncharacterized protein n=1 Tax=Laticauda laticaudata TaxID=8630 RepID=A0A8C5SAE1_LATLA
FLFMELEHLVNPVCYYCFQFLFPKNYRMRLLPKMKITSRIEKILNREKKNYRLSLKQTKFLRKYKESKNVLLITCNSCKKTTRHYGMSREEFNLKTPNLKILSNRSTPLINKNSGSKRGKSSSGLRYYLFIRFTFCDFYRYFYFSLQQSSCEVCCTDRL